MYIMSTACSGNIGSWLSCERAGFIKRDVLPEADKYHHGKLAQVVVAFLSEPARRHRWPGFLQNECSRSMCPHCAYESMCTIEET